MLQSAFRTCTRTVACRSGRCSTQLVPAISTAFRRSFGAPVRKPFTGNRAKKILSLDELQEREAMAAPAIDEPLRVRAKVKNVRTSGKKMIHMARLITGMKVDDAMAQLYFIKKRRSHVFQRAINFAISVAENEHDTNPENLRVETAVVNKGQTMKRPRFHGRGKTGRRDHHHCHIVVTLVEDTPETAAAAAVHDGQDLTMDDGLDDDEEYSPPDNEEGTTAEDLDMFEVDGDFKVFPRATPATAFGLRGLKSVRNKRSFDAGYEHEDSRPTVRMSRRTAAAPVRDGSKAKQKWSLLSENDVGFTWRSRFLRGNRGGKHDKDLDVELVTEVDKQQLARAAKYSTWGANSL